MAQRLLSLTRSGISLDIGIVFVTVVSHFVSKYVTHGMVLVYVTYGMVLVSQWHDYCATEAVACAIFSPSQNWSAGDQMTPFYPKRTLSINVAYSRLERELFCGWTLFLSGKKTTVKNSEGKEVCFAGNVEFAGSMRELFWNGFFEADFKKIIKEQIDQTLKDCESHRELAKAALNETADLLREFSRKVYDRMAEIDQRIRGNGDPNMAQRQAVVDKVKALNTDIEALTEAATKQLKSSRRWRWVAFFLV